MDTNNIFWRAWKIIEICENDLTQLGDQSIFSSLELQLKKTH